MPFSLVRNDLTAIYADAIVITANEHLRITGGVGAMVAQAAGFEALQNACNKIGFCETGHAVATPNFNLANTRMIIHAVGPFWHDGDEHERTLLRSAYDSALNCAFHKGAESIALPLISAGSFGCPPEISLEIAREAIRAFLETHEADVTLRCLTRLPYKQVWRPIETSPNTSTVTTSKSQLAHDRMHGRVLIQRYKRVSTQKPVWLFHKMKRLLLPISF